MSDLTGMLDPEDPDYDADMREAEMERQTDGVEYAATHRDDRFAELERLTRVQAEGAQRMRDHLAQADARIVELEAKLDRATLQLRNKDDAYAALRHAHAELENQAAAMRRTIVSLRTDIRH